MTDRLTLNEFIKKSQDQYNADAAGVPGPFDKPKPSQRLYLPTLAELIDRLSIVQLKAIFIPENRDAYMAEIKLIEHDISLILNGVGAMALGAEEVRMIMLIMLSNRVIWESESKARAGGDEQDKLLKLTHSINGVRNAAKNRIAAFTGERKDLKIDCLAADLPAAYGNWNVLE